MKWQFQTKKCRFEEKKTKSKGRQPRSVENPIVMKEIGVDAGLASSLVFYSC
jgi:hypothetical protein